MSRFERELVHSFNDFFTENGIRAISYRIKQSKFTDQFCDILVDSKDPSLYLAIENKSISLKNRSKLYFSQHFSTANGIHQIERITDFLQQSGRRGYLALEVRAGPGKANRAFLVPWEYVYEAYTKNRKGLSVEEVERLDLAVELKRNAHKYLLSNIFT